MKQKGFTLIELLVDVAIIGDSINCDQVIKNRLLQHFIGSNNLVNFISL